jgi:hypothetical protein
VLQSLLSAFVSTAHSKIPLNSYSSVTTNANTIIYLRRRSWQSSNTFNLNLFVADKIAMLYLLVYLSLA